jgi:MFS family permease
MTSTALGKTMPDAIATEAVSSRSRTFDALSEPAYRRFYVGQGISLIGTWLQLAAVRWIVFAKSDSEFMLGAVEAASLLPGLFVGLAAGAMADRVVPRTMILWMQVVQMILAFVLAALVGLGIEQIWQLAVILALTRISVTFEMPSRQVFLYDLVGRERLPNAIALNSGLFNASRVVGPALAGVCLSGLGATSCFALNGVSYVAAIVALLTIPLAHRRSPGGKGGMAEFLGGLSYLRRNRRVATLFLMMAFFGIVGMGYDAMIPAYARRVVGTAEGGYSVLLASSGIGATLGALLVARSSGGERREWLVLSGLILFATCLAASAWLPPLAGERGAGTARLVVASACLLGVGAGAVIFYSATQTLIQSAVPDHLRGRVMGVWMIVYSGSVPLGALWTGRVALSQGVTFAIGLSAALCVAVAAAGFASGVIGIKRPDDPTVIR